MNTLILFCLLVLLPVCTTISCFSCIACNDPFSSSGVTITIGNTYCKKLGTLGVMTRSGETSCSSSSWYLGSGVSCCQTDFCNGARANYQTPFLLVVSLGAIFAKILWV